MGQPMRFRLRVRHYEVDEYGHVNHANYVHYLEAARIEALEAVGLPLGEMRRQGYIIVAADLAVKYHSPARSGEMLEIVTTSVTCAALGRYGFRRSAKQPASGWW